MITKKSKKLKKAINKKKKIKKNKKMRKMINKSMEKK